MQPLPPAQRADELFDVVNAQDEVIGQATRRTVHTEKLWHRAVHALVRDPAGRVFLQKRSRLKDTSPGCWDSSCSGHVDSGEDYDTAVVRELAEEIGLTVLPAHGLHRLWRETARAETGWEFVWVYELHSTGPFQLHPSELETAAWFTISEVDAALAARPRDFTRAFQFLWPRVVAASTASARGEQA